MRLVRRGSWRDFHPPLRPGDVVTTTVENLGGTSNRVVAGPPAREIRPWASA
jgi:2-keto-4-pentenoate hydratase/2-oxohepta-3-ene-1,7-dioic acid hydratase in catechol pathway